MTQISHESEKAAEINKEELTFEANLTNVLQFAIGYDGTEDQYVDGTPFSLIDGTPQHTELNQLSFHLGVEIFKRVSSGTTEVAVTRGI
jgi:hypothetical protein